MSHYDEEDARELARYRFENGMGRGQFERDTTPFGRYFNEEYDSLDWASETRLNRTVVRGFRKFNVHDGGRK